MKNLEESIRLALGELSRRKEKTEKGRCPDEEVLTLFLEGGLSPQERNRVLEHLNLCTRCLDVVVLGASCTVQEGSEEVCDQVQPGVIEAAKGRITKGLDRVVLDLVVRFWRGSIEVIHSSLKALPPHYQTLAPAYRSIQEERPRPVPLRMEKSFGTVTAEIEVARRPEGLWNIQVLLKGDGGTQVPEGIRVTLKDLSLMKELQSLPATQGLAGFTELPSGEYSLEFKKKGTIIGTMSLSLT